MNTPESRSIPDIVRDIAADARALIQGEFQLARAEAGEKLNRVIYALVAIIGGVLLGFSALNVLLIAIVEALEQYMPTWLASVIVGLVVALIGYILVRQGAQSLKPDRLSPNRTTGSLSKDADLVKGRAA